MSYFEAISDVARENPNLSVSDSNVEFWEKVYAVLEGTDTEKDAD